MNIDDFFKTKDAASYLATEEARLYLVQSDPRYLEPTLSRLHFLRFRLLFDQWDDTGGGGTQIFGVYEAHKESSAFCTMRHANIERGAFGSFDLNKGVTVEDKVIKMSLIKSIEREYIAEDLPAIGAGSSICTNTNYVEVEWMFNGTSRRAGFALPNPNMTKLYGKLRQLADSLIAIKSP